MMTQEKTYNGWKNYETWNIMLWVNNDEGISTMVEHSLFCWLRHEVENDNLNGKDIQEYFVNSVSFDTLREIMCIDEAFPTNQTRDGVRLDDSSIDWNAIRSAIAERLDSRMIDSLNEYFREILPNNVY
jgi:hypothetical protein